MCESHLGLEGRRFESCRRSLRLQSQHENVQETLPSAEDAITLVRVGTLKVTAIQSLIRDRSMVGRHPLEMSIGVRLPVPKPCVQSVKVARHVANVEESARYRLDAPKIYTAVAHEDRARHNGRRVMMNGVAEAPNGENKTQIWCDSREPTGCRKARWPSSLLSKDKERVRVPSAVPF